MTRMNENGAEKEQPKQYTILTDTMARSMKPGDRKLTDRTVKGLKLKPASRKGRGYWFLFYNPPLNKKKRSEMSLGSYPDVSIAEARERANEARKLLAKGIDPLLARDAEKSAVKKEEAVPTFELAARSYIDQKKAGWRNAKHAAQWTSTLETYAFPYIGNRKVATLSVEDFRKVLAPIWLEKAETARRVKQRCSRIIQWCCANKYVQNNVLNVVTELLPDAKEARRPQHFPALPWQKVPEFVNTIVRKDRLGSSRPLMEWLVLTAARSGESRNLTWDQIDMENAIWNIPPDNTKMNRSHDVPLSNRCLQILDEQMVYCRHVGTRETPFVLFQ